MGLYNGHNSSNLDTAVITTKGDLVVGSGTNTASRLGVGADGQVLVSDSSQAGGVKWSNTPEPIRNYFKFPWFEENATTGWSLFNTTVSGGMPTGTINAGASSITTFDTTTTGALADGFSLRTAIASGTITAGQGFISDLITINNEDKTKVLQIKHSYSAYAGLSLMNFSGTTSNTWGLFVYDTANAGTQPWIQLSGSYNYVGNGDFYGTFQVPYNSTTIRVAIICINSNTSGAVTMLWDSFFVGHQVTSSGAAMSDTATYTGSLTYAGTTATNITSQTYRQSRNGDKLYVSGAITFSGAANANGSFRIPLPSGLIIDTTKIANYTVVGSAAAYFNSNKYYTGHVRMDGANNSYVVIHRWDDSGATDVDWAGNTTAGSNVPGGVAITAIDGMSFFFTVPISSWSSNTVQSSDADNRKLFEYYSAATQTTAGPINFETKGYSSHGAVTTGVGVWKFTAPATDIYTVKGFINSGTNLDFTVYKGGSVYATAGVTNAAGHGMMSVDVMMNAAEYIDIRPPSSQTISGTIQISKFIGTQTIQQSDKINARYTNTSGQAINNGVSAVLTGWTLDYDLTGSMNIATGVYTILRPGRFRTSHNITINQAAYTAGTNRYIQTIVNGVTTCTQSVWATQTEYISLTGSLTKDYKIGDTITVSVNNVTGSNITILNSAADCWVCIDAV